jgi:hypothetical protein
MNYNFDAAKLLSMKFLPICLPETGVLDPKPKLLGFHMPRLATCPYMPNKEAW